MSTIREDSNLEESYIVQVEELGGMFFTGVYARIIAIDGRSVQFYHRLQSYGDKLDPHIYTKNVFRRDQIFDHMRSLTNRQCETALKVLDESPKQPIEKRSAEEVVPTNRSRGKSYLSHIARDYDGDTQRRADQLMEIDWGMDNAHSSRYSLGGKMNRSEKNALARECLDPGSKTPIMASALNKMFRDKALTSTYEKIYAIMLLHGGELFSDEELSDRAKKWVADQGITCSSMEKIPSVTYFKKKASILDDVYQSNLWSSK